MAIVNYIFQPTYSYGYSIDKPLVRPAFITLAALRFETPSPPDGAADKVRLRSPPSLGQVTETRGRDDDEYEARAQLRALLC